MASPSNPTEIRLALDQHVAESESLVARWREQYPGTTLGDLGVLDPEFAAALLRNMHALGELAPDAEDDDDEW